MLTVKFNKLVQQMFGAPCFMGKKGQAEGLVPISLNLKWDR